MNNNLDELRNAISIFHELTDDEWFAFSSIWKAFSAKRKEIITRAGEKEKFLYFVTEGIQRIYYFDEQDREATLIFTYAPSFGGILDAFMLQKPSIYYYETLTTSTFFRTTFSELNQVMNDFPKIEVIIRKGISQALSGVLERMVELQCFSSEEKFKSLLKRSPHVLTLIPHKYLANYLGIDPTNFSKLINRVAI